MKKERISTHGCVQILFAINSRKQKQKQMMAGLLTYSRFERLPEFSYQLSVISYQFFEDCSLFTVYCSLKKPVAKVLFKTLIWSLQQRVLFRNLTGFPFIDSTERCFDTKIIAKVEKIFYQINLLKTRILA